MSTFKVTIKRTSLGLGDLVIDGSENGTSDIGLVTWTEPAMRAQVAYAPDGAFTHGSTALGWRWQQTALNFDVCPLGATSETQARSLYAELLAALTQWRFTLHLDAAGAPRESWTCDPGSIQQGPRTFIDIEHSSPLWECSVPADPVRST